MRVLALADAHIASPQAPEARAFLAFLEEFEGKAELLVIAGDLFEFFVGRQARALEVFAPLLSALARFARHTPVVFLEGNHDFLLKGVLPPGCEVREEFLLETPRGKILFTHGDTLTPSLSYFWIRRFLRSAPVLWLVEHLPSTWVWEGALLWAKWSRAREKLVNDEEIERLKALALNRIAGQADYLVTGHLHRSFQTPLGAGLWIGIGAWQKDRSYLEFEGKEGFRCRNYLRS